MTKAQKKRLKEAADQLENASQILSDIKWARKGIRNDDDYYALEDLEVRVDETRELLNEGFLL